MAPETRRHVGKEVSDSQGGSDCPISFFTGTNKSMCFSVARILVFATGLSACLATWPLGSVTDSDDGRPSLVAPACPSSDGILVEDTDERGEEEEREDDRFFPLICWFAPPGDAADVAVIHGERRRCTSPPRPAHSLGPIRAPPHRA